MESRLISKTDILEAVRNWKWTTGECEGKAQEAIYQICLKHKHYESSPIVWRDDVIRVEFEGGNGRFKGTKKIRVGANLFDEEFEKAVRRKFVGKPFNFVKDGDQIRCTVTECLRLVIPVLTDEMVKEEQIEGVETFDQLYTYLRRDALKNLLYDDSYAFMNQYLETCSYEISDKDLGTMIENEMERCRGIAKSMNLVFDEMPKDELLGAVGCPDIPAFKKMITKIFTRDIKAALVELNSNAAAQLTADKISETGWKLREQIVSMALDAYEERKAS